MRTKPFVLGVLLLMLGIMCLAVSCKNKCPKQDVYTIQYCESTTTVVDVPYTTVIKAIREPQEDMIIYLNGKVLKIITE